MSDSDGDSRPQGELESRIEAVVEQFLSDLQAGRAPEVASVLEKHADIAAKLRTRLALVERMYAAGQFARSAGERSVLAARSRRLKCPHCGNGIQLVEPSLSEVTCLNCGSSFAIDPDATASYPATVTNGGIGRFQVLELLGRGAFGDVYKARDPDLDRTVAIKIPRAGYFGTPEEEQRFLREARSAAGLKHPGIVQVHEIAHHDGLPYIVSEYIEGLTLADLISGGRPGFRECAELVVQVSEALAFAHEHNVVHRDIKPSNILLAASAKGGRATNGTLPFAAYVTDFGLARRDEGEITVTLDGQVLGTPAYMSPEQAAGESQKVDGRSDVYSLGVVLYELLSGELPFRGSRRMLLHQVLHDEPRAPRILNDRVPTDLETICLKAMAKEPSRRYASAAELADDLLRFLRGDPIRARPMGRGERIWRWCRRNPLISGLSATVAVSLIVGATGSAYFAVEANSRAAAERRARHETEGVLTRGLIRQFSPDADSVRTLDYQEGEALWELATIGGESVWLRALDEATQDPILAAQLRSRSEPAMIALVGLNWTRKETAAKLLLSRLEDRSLTLTQRVDIALTALELADRPEPLRDACWATFREILDLSPKIENWRIWGIHIAESAARLDAETVAPLLAACLTRTDDDDDRNAMTKGLVVVASRRPAMQGAELLSKALAVVGEDERALENLADGIADLSARLPPESRESLCRDVGARLTKSLASSTRDHDRTSLVRGLAALLPRLETGEASRLATLLGQELVQKCQAPWQATDLATAIGERPPHDATQIAESITRALTDALRRETDPDIQHELASRIIAVTALLSDADAARLCAEPARLIADAAGPVAEAMLATGGHDRRANLWITLTKLTARMARSDAAQLCAPVAARVLECLKEWKRLGVAAGPVDDSDVIHWQLRMLCALADRMEPVEGARITLEGLRTVILLISAETDPRILGWQAEQLHDAMAGIDLETANQAAVEAAGVLKKALAQTEDPLARSSLVDGLADLTVRMTGVEAKSFRHEVAALLADAAVRETDVQKLARRSHRLFGLTAEVEPAEAERICAPPFEVLRREYLKEKDGVNAQRLVEELSWLASRRDPVKAFPELTELVLSQRADISDRVPPTALAAIAARLSPAEAVRALDPVMLKLLAERFNLALAQQNGGRSTEARVPDSATVPMHRSRRAPGSSNARSNAWIFAMLQAFDVALPQRAREFATALAKVVSAEPDINPDPSFGELAAAFAPLVDPRSLQDPRCDLEEVLAETMGPPRVGDWGFENRVEHAPEYRCRVNVADLVDLLKMPTCFGPARRVVLSYLGRRYGVTFDNHWAFIRFAQEQGIELDFKNGVRRPDPVALWNELRSNQSPVDR